MAVPQKRFLKGLASEVAVEHYEHLPDLADQEVYDRDDSFFNDQEESGMNDPQRVKLGKS